MSLFLSLQLGCTYAGAESLLVAIIRVISQARCVIVVCYGNIEIVFGSLGMQASSVTDTIPQKYAHSTFALSFSNFQLRQVYRNVWHLANHVYCDWGVREWKGHGRSLDHEQLRQDVYDNGLEQI